MENRLNRRAQLLKRLWFFVKLKIKILVPNLFWALYYLILLFEKSYMTDIKPSLQSSQKEPNCRCYGTYMTYIMAAILL